MKCSFLLPIAATGLVLSACGSLNPNTGTAPALAKLSGGLLNPQSLSVAGSVRVAVVWKSETPGKFNVAEDLPVQPVFPSSFTIELGPPPAGAMNSIPAPRSASSSTFSSGSGAPPPKAPAPSPSAQQPSPYPDFQFAIGVVVAYVDKNGNGKLDLVPSGASGYIDQIIATNTEMAIYYIQGPIPPPLLVKDSAGNVETEGYNLVRIPPCPSPAGGPGHGFGGGGVVNPACTTPPPAPVVDAGTCQKPTWLKISTPFELTVASTPEVAALMCESDSSTGGSTGSGTGTGPLDPSIQPAQYPDPCDPNLACASDGSNYQLATCATVSQGICLGTYTTCTSVRYSRPTPAPAGWPCVH
jgi:hypothetical protein